MSERRGYFDDVPDWLLAIGPIAIVGLTAIVVYLTWPFDSLEGMSQATTTELLWMLTLVGAIAGVVPVAVGMLWYPYIRRLDSRFVNAFVALGAGVLAFIAIEMADELVEYGGELESTAVAGSVALVGIAGTFLAMYGLSRWRQRSASDPGRSGLQIAYLVAIALGLHSIGEGLAIGVSLVNEQATLVLLLVVGFVIHNVLEGLTIVAAMARDARMPRLAHFGAVGLLAGGPVILGGWIGSLGTAPLVAMAFYAIAVGAIVQALVEMMGLVKFDADRLITRTTAAMFVVGFALMFVLEDVIVEGWLLPS